MAFSNRETLPALPQELFEMTIEHAHLSAVADGHKNTLRNLRLVSREISQKTERIYARAHFTKSTITCMLQSERSLRRALSLARFSNFGKGIRNLIINVHNLQRPIAIAPLYSLLLSLFGELATRKTFKKLVISCDEVHQGDFRMHGEDVNQESPHVQDATSLQTIFRAMAISTLTIESLIMDTTDTFSWCLPAYYLVTMPRSHANFEDVLQTVKNLKLDLWFPADCDAEQERFYSLIAGAPKLETLNIRIRGGPEHNRCEVIPDLLYSHFCRGCVHSDLWQCWDTIQETFPNNACKALLLANYPNLKRLAIAMSSFDMSDMSGFVNRHPNLEELELHLARITTGEELQSQANVERRRVAVSRFLDWKYEDKTLTSRSPWGQEFRRRMDSLREKVNIKVDTYAVFQEYVRVLPHDELLGQDRS